MKNQKNIKVGQIAYFYSPYHDGELLKVFVKSVELAHIDLEENKTNHLSFIVEIRETIIDATSDSLKKSDSFEVVEEYLEHKLVDAMSKFIDSKTFRLNQVNHKIKLIEKNLKKLNEVYSENNEENHMVIEKEEITIAGEPFVVLKNTEIDFYFFDKWMIERLNLNERFIINAGKPVKLDLSNGKDPTYKMVIEHSFSLNGTTTTRGLSHHLDVNLSDIYPSFDSALYGIVRHIEDLLKIFKREKVLLEDEIDKIGK